jgi:hypothetical protein
MTLLADVATLEWYPPRPAAPVEAAGGALGACPPPPVVEASFHPLTISAFPAPALSLLDRPHSLVLALVFWEERGSYCDPNRLLSVECFLNIAGLG